MHTPDQDLYIHRNRSYFYIKRKVKLKHTSLKRRLTAEFIGSFLLVLAAISPIILFHDILKSTIGIAILTDALAVGFVLFALIESIGKVSGCHINPAVTIALMSKKEMNMNDGISYIIVQILGGFMGAISSHIMFMHKFDKIIAIAQIERNGGAYFSEFIGTFFLVLVIICCRKNNSRHLSFAVGLLVAGLIVSTSSTMFANPQVTIARVFTYCIAGIAPIDALVFIPIQIVGGLFGAFISEIILSENIKKI